jgi:hypothetical protein
MSADASYPPTFAELQRALDRVNRWRLSPGISSLGAKPAAATEQDERAHRDLELRFVEAERGQIEARAKGAPASADAFVAWFVELEKTGPGQHDRLFDWLAERASLGQMSWFLRQEVAGEAGFDDLVALTQVKMPTRVKLELARNYWDEMGQGHEAGMHGPMLSRLADELGIEKRSATEVVAESLALANLLVALAVHRRYAYHSIGALGAVELTAPARAAKVNAGLKRLGVGGDARRYFALHATLDVKHWEAWSAEVIAPLVASDPAVARPIAEGALMRLAAGARCFDAYRCHFGLA